MFRRNVLFTILVSNLVLLTAVLLLSITMFVKLFTPGAPMVAGAPTQQPAAAQEAPQAEPPAPAADAPSKEFGKKLAIPLDKALKKGKPVAVLFYADWCGFCKRFAPTFTELSKSELKKKYTFVAVNSDSPEARDAMMQYGVRGFPSLYLVNPETIDKAHVSNALMFQPNATEVMKEQFNKFLKEGSAGVTQPPPPQPEPAAAGAKAPAAAH